MLLGEILTLRVVLMDESGCSKATTCVAVAKMVYTDLNYTRRDTKCTHTLDEQQLTTATARAT